MLLLSNYSSFVLYVLVLCESNSFYEPYYISIRSDNTLNQKRMEKKCFLKFEMIARHKSTAMFSRKMDRLRRSYSHCGHWWPLHGELYVSGCCCWFWHQKMCFFVGFIFLFLFSVIWSSPVASDVGYVHIKTKKQKQEMCVSELWIRIANVDKPKKW